MAAASGSLWNDEAFGDFGKEELDAFFAADGAAPNGAGPARPPPGRSDIEAEYSRLSRSQSPARGGGPVAAAPEGVASFALDDGDSDGVDATCADSEHVQDCRVPELPEAPGGFSAEDRRLREALAGFYLARCPEKLGGVNAIVEQYRGRAVSHLWVQLASKYRLRVPDVVEGLAGTLYLGAPFEQPEDGGAGGASGSSALPPETLASPEGREELLHAWLRGGPGGVALSEGALRALCLRGLPSPGADGQLRAQLWKVMLGYLPAQPRSEWPSIEAERRASYARWKADLVAVSESFRVDVRGVQGQQVADSLSLLQQIQKDVHRTQPLVEFFQRPATQAALSSLLLVYARRNPEVQYIQGMNEVAAVLLHVASEASADEHAEADAFWCFSLLMQDIRGAFIQAVDGCSGHGAPSHASPAAKAEPGAVGKLLRALRLYDPELGAHLEGAGVPVGVFAFRWCTVLFAQDLPLAGVVRLWDCLLGDPLRFELLSQVGLAALLTSRERLLAASEQGQLAELVSGAPRMASLEALLAHTWAICALERRAQTPPFPTRSAAQLVQDLSGWARGAAAQLAPALRPAAGALAGGLGAGLAQRAPPLVKETVGQASEKVASAARTAVASAPSAAQAFVTSAPAAAHSGAHAVASWFNEPAPIKPESVEQAGAAAASLWQAVRARGAEAVSRAQTIAGSEQAEAAKEAAKATLGTAVGAAAGASAAAGGAVLARLAGALAADAPRPAPEARGEPAAERPRAPYHAA